MSAKAKLYFPISIRFMLFIILMIGLQSLAMLNISYTQIKSGLVHEKEQDIKLAIADYNDNLSQTIRRGKAILLSQPLEILNKYHYISRTYIISPDLTIISARDKTNTGKNLSQLLNHPSFSNLKNYLKSPNTFQANLSRTWYDEDSHTLNTVSPSKSSSEHFLFIQIDIRKAEDEAFENLVSSFIPIIIVLLLAGLAMTFYFRNLVSSRIKLLQQAAENFTNQGNFKLPTNTRNDELNKLKDALGTLMLTVQTQHHEIKLREQNLTAVLDHIGDAVIAIDPNSKILLFNPVAERITGWEKCKAESNSIDHILKLYNTNTYEPLTDIAKLALNPYQASLEQTPLFLISKNGNEHRIELSAYPILNQDKRMTGSVISFRDITAQYSFEKEANREHSFMQAMMNNTPAVIYSCDTSGHITFANKRFETLFDLSLSTLRGKQFKNILPDEIARALVIHDQDIIRDKKPITFEQTFSNNRGTHKYLMAKFPIFDDQGNCSAVCTIANNTNKIWELQRKLSQLMRDTPLGAIEWDENHHVADWNPAAEKIFGYSKEEALGKHVSFLFDDEENPFNVIDTNIKTTQIEHHRLNKNRTSSGALVSCDWFNTPHFGQTGDAKGLTSFISDVTSQQHALRSLVNKEFEQSEILNSITNAIFIISENGAISSINRSSSALFGYSPSDIIGKSLEQIIPLNNTSTNQTYVARWLNEVGEMKAKELTANDKNGLSIPVLSSLNSLPKAADQKQQFLVSLHDLREKKSQEEILRRTQKMESLGLLTGGIAHDFNNILGIVQGYADLLDQALQNQPKLNKYSQEIRRASERGTRLTAKLLASSKKKRADAQVVNISQAIELQQAMLEKAVSPKVKFEIKLQRGLWLSYLDSGDLEDAILNIVVNADHAMPEGGKLFLFTYNTEVTDTQNSTLDLPRGDYVALCIRDTGSGIPQEALNHIFDPFYSTKGDQGTGLGLSQTYGFVQRSHGHIKVDSTPGEGTQFTLFFPRHHGTTDQTNTEKPTVSQASAAESQKRILVVDDEKPLLEMCEEVLCDSGYEVLTAEDGEAALKLMKEYKVDLLFSDIVMPGLNGYELAEEARKQHPELKILLASGFDANHFEAYGDDELRKNMVSKPYSPFLMLNKINTLLES